MELKGLFEVFVIDDKKKAACIFLHFNELFKAPFFIHIYKKRAQSFEFLNTKETMLVRFS